MGVPALIIDLGTKTLGPGVYEVTVPFDQHYDYLPSVILTSTTVQGGGSVSAYVSEVCTTSFKINVSAPGGDGSSVDVCWRAILDRQRGPQGKGNSPQFVKPEFYSLSESFTDNTGNVYSQATANKLVLWLQMTSGQPTSKAAPYMNAYYVGSPSAGNLQSLSGSNTPERLTVTLSDAENKSITIPGNSALSHSTLPSYASATVGSDKAFSVSVWVKVDVSDTGSVKQIFSKDYNISLYECEYEAYITNDREVNFRLSDDTTDGMLRIETDVIATDIFGTAPSPKWMHLVFTYVGGTAAGANQTARAAYADGALKIYVNGHIQESTGISGVGAYASMVPKHDKATYVGRRGNELYEFPGDMSEFAMWTDHALTAAEVLATYSGSFGQSYGA